ncbi:Putative Branched-chain amino acid aminotransferase/4-amino-4-deoxychorismate lyase [Aspergillus calidoustus]|uniref:Putative Branched-chain amino acid aminotransferase/4-amino-4-deoxychorismate lyase n=1 Tax=Aspergillus calidoustus TaxID=454130 RepID=A0A0U5GIS0_ASPCI|nr:Putative Branched-chain amino acid aminotransferase/4-amino-4-deoxychorismate lyase [Aspergillus calidoustus]
MSSMDKIFSEYRARQAQHEMNHGVFSKGIAFVEGEFVEPNDARIPLLDEGFMHSDLTYDVPSVWNGRFFRLDDHIQRLVTSCEKMRLRFPLSTDRVKEILTEMMVRSGIQDAFVELIVTRGMTSVRGAKAEDLLDSNLYLLVLPYVWVMDPEKQYTGGSAIIARTVRRTPPGAMDPTIKNLQWGDLTRGLFEAMDRGSTYPFLTDGDTHLTEGSGFNIFLIKDGVLYSPNRGVLEGITRKSVIDVARNNKIEVRLETIPVELAYHCDEIFMCTTAGGIMPITTLDDKPVNDGQVGPITKVIWDGYWAMHYDPAYSLPIKYN